MFQRKKRGILTWRWLATSTFLLPTPCLGQINCLNMPSALEQVVCSEKEFAKESMAKGVKTAFLDFLAEDAILFRPGPVPGKPWMNEKPAPAITLSWMPCFGGVSLSGDLGFTLGPYESRDPTSQRPPRYGHYFTIWKKQVSGPWKVFLDFGISHPQPTKSPDPFQKEDLSKWKKPTGFVPSQERLMETDRNFSKKQAQEGIKQAYTEVLSSEAWLFSEGRYPHHGPKRKAASLEELEKQIETISCGPEGAGLSLAGDLGYTYGACRISEDQKLYYVRLWRFHEPQGYRLLVEVRASPVDLRKKAGGQP